MISHEYQCIFIHIPKCAGTSIESALGHLDNHTGRGGQDHRTIRTIEQPFLKPNIVSSKDNLQEIFHRVQHHYHKARNPRNKYSVTAEEYNRYFKFTFVRNPWDRAFSWYKNVIRDKNHRERLNISDTMLFSEFLKRHAGKGALKPQTYWLKNFSNLIDLDFIGRFENLNEDFEKVCYCLRISKIVLPHKIQGSGTNYRDFYDRESIETIEKVYREDIEAFGYSFET